MAPEEDLIYVVLDGSRVRDLALDLPPSATTGSAIADWVFAAAPALRGLALPDAVRSAAISRLPEGFLESEYAGDEAPAAARRYLDAVTSQLEEEPMVISVLEGRNIRVILEDEDDFAMVAENLFTEIDKDDTGKLSKDEIKAALESMGVDLGIPPIPDMSHLLPEIVKKHGAEGKEELGQAQFAHLLQLVLQDLADSLAKTPITVIHNVQVLNGSKLRKILDDPKIFDPLTEEMRKDWAKSVEAAKDKRLIALLDSRCPHLGLPSTDENQALSVIYQQILAGMKEQIDGELNEASFREVVKFLLEKTAAQLDATPMFC